MEPLPLSVEDIVPNVTQDARNAMGDVILMFARLDSMVSHLVLLAFGLSLSEGPILLGNMDTRSKLDRLKQLYDHHGMREAADQIANLKAAHHHYVDTRNLIAHSTCSGSHRADPEVILFAPVRIAKRQLDQVPIYQVYEHTMRRAATFAKDASDRIFAVTEALSERPSKPPLAPPSFPPLIDPTQDKKGDGRRGKRHGGKKRE